MLALYCLTLAVSFVCSVFLTWTIRNLATRNGWASRLNFAHHIHSRPIPRVGGLAIFLTFFGLVSAFAGLFRMLTGAPVDPDLAKLILPAGCLFITGVLDDLIGLSPKAKLMGQIVGGLCLYFSGLHLFNSSWDGFHPWVATGLSLICTVFLVVLMSNAMNLIDGLDGLAAGVAIFSILSILIFALFTGAVSIAIAALILAGAVGGFLVFNFSPASIFLGDSGSLFIGMMLSGLVVALARRQDNVVNSLMMPVFFFAVPLADTAISVLRRFLGRRPLFQADKGHVHHMLLNLGLSHRAAVCVLYGVSALATMLSLVMLHPSALLLGSAALALVLLIFFCVRKLGYQEFAEIGAMWRRSAEHRAASVPDVPLPEEEGVYFHPSSSRLSSYDNSNDLTVELPELTTMIREVPAEEAAP